MTRWFIAILALTGGILLWIWLRPSTPAAPVGPAIASALASMPRTPSTVVIPPSGAGAVPAASSGSTEPLARQPVPDAGPPEAPGPYQIDLGQHTITLKDAQDQNRVARLRLKLVIDTAAGRREVMLRREELVRMLFFLGSHRDADGATGDEGRLRFQDDLLERYRNVVRSGRVERLDFEDYAIVPKG